MKEIIHADVFFFVTTVVVVVLGAIITTVLIYAVSILRNIKHISKKIKQGSDEILQDFELLRERFKQDGFKFLALGGFLSKFFGKKKKSAK